MKLFVGNLPYSVDSAELQAIFEQNGLTVDHARVITDRETGRSRGFGFVDTPDGEEAISKMSGYQMDGRGLTVNEARQQEERRGPGGPGGGQRRERRDRW